ncbi:MAG: class I SAM-dependent methyltransferase [Deltaproteobacteria bacterium]|nr:class I SAM-dependent methyltransferase [Deltaproteobacteria bacterium]
MRKDYYAKKLSAERLWKVYEIASSRVKRYLEEEIRFVMDRVTPDAHVLELGCGYGRVLYRLAAKTERVVGIDTSRDNLVMAAQRGRGGTKLVLMDAASLGFSEKIFDLVVCIQNGISAFRVDPFELMRETMRAIRPGGRALFSSYSEKFWPHRLEWFREQARHGLLGEIDEETTGKGVIVCKDGFRAGTFGPEDFLALGARLGLPAEVFEVDGSSIFCEIVRS